MPEPSLLVLNEDLRRELGLPDLGADTASIYSGAVLPGDAQPIAAAYSGHQFGSFNPTLGDGRAILLGEVVTPTGARFDLQLKGSGRTPFSRGGDGRAALGPILREALVSEAMHHLGIPTTRVLAAVATGDEVRRERYLPGAVLTRVGASHLRVGTLQFLASRRETGLLADAVAHALARHYPLRADDPNPALALLQEVTHSQAMLIARWMHVGFVHGVMNTDNTTLSGEVIDYGPCAFIDTYDPAAVFSSIDRTGRYAFGNQGHIGQWNMARLGEALLPMLDPNDDSAIALVHGVLETYATVHAAAILDGFRRKLGLAGEDERDEEIVRDLMGWMKADERDFTQSFRELAASLRSEAPMSQQNTFLAWNERWRARLADRPAASVADAMDAVNPIYIPRNHLVEEALDSARTGDMEPFHRFARVLATPYTAQAGAERYAQPAPPSFGEYQTFCGT